MAFSYTNKKDKTYYLHSMQVELKGNGKLQTIYYFAKVAAQNSLDKVPEGFEIVENKRTGLPILRRKR